MSSKNEEHSSGKFSKSKKLTRVLNSGGGWSVLLVGPPAVCFSFGLEDSLSFIFFRYCILAS